MIFIQLWSHVCTVNDRDVLNDSQILTKSKGQNIYTVFLQFYILAE